MDIKCSHRVSLLSFFNGLLSTLKKQILIIHKNCYFVFIYSVYCSGHIKWGILPESSNNLKTNITITYLNDTLKLIVIKLMHEQN